MILSIYAVKCRIEREELEHDAFELMEFLNGLKDRKRPENDHPFTEKDVVDALQCYEDESLVTYPINSIINRSGIHIEKNKRNGRSRAAHVKLMNFIRDELNQNDFWRDGSGRKKGSSTQRLEIEQWQRLHPSGTKSECAHALGISRQTVYRWWGEAQSPSDLVKNWRQQHPDNGNKSACATDTGLSRPTVYKYWAAAAPGRTALSGQETLRENGQEGV